MNNIKTTESKKKKQKLVALQGIKKIKYKRRIPSSILQHT